MPRKYSVTRTGKVTKCEVLAVNKETEELVTMNVALEGEFSNEKKLEKAIKNEIDSDTIKFVAVKSTLVEKERRGMTATDWFKYSTMLNDNEAETETEEE